ncbi:hypothetical protein L1987_64136 [Smallanthus sonchifolius]|uniref:Uncharacterized protein n=1 Tax=Smallanthus sonchifolius TaxID=185202 RepID=A0ACB9CF66_9ASTR|nr:hypothetical protein L1987_64136 [Smallanthus sonchifolius]
MQPRNRAEADRLLGMAEKLLEENDLNAARDFALLAQETEPLLNGSDQILAITDVLIAADKRINDNHHHWYAILQINIHRTDDAEFIKQQYHRLALLVHPDKNKFSFSESAFKIVGDAWSVLSDPAKKSAYDKELFEFLNIDLDTVKNQKEKEVQNQREKLPVRRNSGNEVSSENLWTPCPYCYYLYEYPRVYEGYCLRCDNCDRAFQVVAIPSEAMPPTVPGKEAYRCSWPYFPIGFTISVSETAKTATTPDRMPPETSSSLAAPSEGFVEETPSESRSTLQKQEKTVTPAAGGTVSRKSGRPVKNPLF